MKLCRAAVQACIVCLGLLAGEAGAQTAQDFKRLFDLKSKLENQNAVACAKKLGERMRSMRYFGTSPDGLVSATLDENLRVSNLRINSENMLQVDIPALERAIVHSLSRANDQYQQRLESAKSSTSECRK
ncbi:MAG: YbaB/EbfC family nucleoid-associated protein [Hyphomicrobium sp.]